MILLIKKHSIYYKILIINLQYLLMQMKIKLILWLKMFQLYQVPKKNIPLFKKKNADQVSKRVVVKGNMIEDPIESQGCNISCLQQRLQELNQLIEENNNNVNNNDNNFKEENQIIMSKLEEKNKRI